jgi:hypothetical protein
MSISTSGLLFVGVTVGVFSNYHKIYGLLNFVIKFRPGKNLVFAVCCAFASPVVQAFSGRRYPSSVSGAVAVLLQEQFSLNLQELLIFRVNLLRTESLPFEDAVSSSIELQWYHREAEVNWSEVLSGEIVLITFCCGPAENTLLCSSTALSVTWFLATSRQI